MAATTLPPIVPPPEISTPDYDDSDREKDYTPPEMDTGVCKTTYQSACSSLQVPLAKKVKVNLSEREIKLRYRNLGASGAHALAIALTENTRVEELDLEENGLGGEGAMYLCDMLRENSFITHLNLSRNQLGTLGAICVGEMLQINNNLLELNLAENRFRDSDAEYLATGIEKNDRLIYLDLSKNGFSEDGAGHLARAIGNNNSVEVLDLSWNQLRRKGSVSISKGIIKNYCLQTINLAWNGFGYEGSVGIGQMLKSNKYLMELDISNNRINWQGATMIAQGLRFNDNLEVIKIGHNPLTMTGCLDILEALFLNRISAVKHVGFDGIPLSRRCVYVADQIHKLRPFTMTTGGVLDGEDVLGKRHNVRGDPMKILVQYLSDKNIRPLDLFRTFQKDALLQVSREQFIRGLKKARVPLNEYEMGRVLEKMDKGHEGFITYPGMVRGFRTQLMVNREDGRKKAAQDKQKMEEMKRIMEAHLPPISENNSQVARDLTATPRTRLETALSRYQGATPEEIDTRLSSLDINRGRNTTEGGSTSLSSGASIHGVRTPSGGVTKLPRLNMSGPLAAKEMEMNPSNAEKGPSQKKKKKKRRKGLF